MSSYRVKRIAAGVVCLASVPFLFVVSIKGFGSMGKASQVSDTVGVWVFSWGLVCMAVGAALMISWVCFFGDRAS